MRLVKVAELAETAVPQTLDYYAFPEEHWRRIRTNKTRSSASCVRSAGARGVGAFPGGNSGLST